MNPRHTIAAVPARIAAIVEGAAQASKLHGEHCDLGPLAICAFLRLAEPAIASSAGLGVEIELLDRDRRPGADSLRWKRPTTPGELTLRFEPGNPAEGEPETLEGVDAERAIVDHLGGADVFELVERVLSKLESEVAQADAGRVAQEIGALRELVRLAEVGRG